ncbi:MAG: sensor histidine kinase [Actinomycetota bacterium]|nr:sensor histidine kinase [Actinomycetota bacterium]
MRKRILGVSVSAVLLAVTVLGIPAAIATARIVTSDQRAALQRAALRAAVEVSPTYLAGDPVELRAHAPGVSIAVYDVHGVRFSGTGPATLDHFAQDSLRGSTVSTTAHGKFVETVPVSTGERVIAVVRAASPQSGVRLQILAWWLVLVAGGAVAALCAVALAARQSRRLAAPLTELSAAATALGGGDFTTQVKASGVPEMDEVASALQRTSARLAELVERERSFNAHASHQLRTPLTRLQLELEAGQSGDEIALRRATSAAMGVADQLSQTIDDVLHTTRAASTGETFALDELLDECVRRWQPVLAANSRPLRLQLGPSLHVRAGRAAGRQILHVLLDNASRHGSGVVTVRSRESHGAAAIDVSDEGSVAPIRLSGHDGLGLGMAAALALAQDGRLLVEQPPQGTRFTVLLPVAD